MYPSTRTLLRAASTRAELLGVSLRTTFLPSTNQIRTIRIAPSSQVPTPQDKEPLTSAPLQQNKKPLTSPPIQENKETLTSAPLQQDKEPLTSAPLQPENTLYRRNKITQGHVNDPSNRNKSDPQCQSASAGRDVRMNGSGSPLDSASAEYGMKQTRPLDVGSGNKEGVGFVNQNGSASATARKFEIEAEMVKAEENLKAEREKSEEAAWGSALIG